jgi:hypothetical protein
MSSAVALVEGVPVSDQLRGDRVQDLGIGRREALPHARRHGKLLVG